MLINLKNNILASHRYKPIVKWDKLNYFIRDEYIYFFPISITLFRFQRVSKETNINFFSEMLTCTKKKARPLRTYIQSWSQFYYNYLTKEHKHN